MYTPGPWRLTEEPGNAQGKYAESCRRWIIDAPGKRAAMAISEAWKSKDDPDIWDEVRADARLMAAAPELLEILEALLNRYVVLERVDQLAADAFEVLKKAKGD